MKRVTKLALAVGASAAILTATAPMSFAGGIHRTGCDEGGFTKITEENVDETGHCFADAGEMDLKKAKLNVLALRIDSGDNKIKVVGEVTTDGKPNSTAEVNLEKNQTWHLGDQPYDFFEPTSIKIY